MWPRCAPSVVGVGGECGAGVDPPIPPPTPTQAFSLPSTLTPVLLSTSTGTWDAVGDSPCIGWATEASRCLSVCSCGLGRNWLLILAATDSAARKTEGYRRGLFRPLPPGLSTCFGAAAGAPSPAGSAPQEPPPPEPQRGLASTLGQHPSSQHPSRHPSEPPPASPTAPPPPPCSRGHATAVGREGGGAGGRRAGRGGVREGREGGRTPGASAHPRGAAPAPRLARRRFRSPAHPIPTRPRRAPPGCT